MLNIGFHLNNEVPFEKYNYEIIESDIEKKSDYLQLRILTSQTINNHEISL